MAHNEFKKVCPVCGTANDKTNERCKKCNSDLLDGLQSGDITIDSRSIKRFRQINNGPDIICPVCKTHNKPVARNCVQCGTWLLDEYWRASKANDGYSHKLPSFLKRTASAQPRKDKSFSQSKWSLWMLLTFAFFLFFGKMLPSNDTTNYPDSSLPAMNYGQDDQNLQLVDLPPNGDTCYYKNAEAIAPFNIETEPGANYFIKLVDADTGNTAVTVFIQGGQSVNMKVPLGIYEFRYASGGNWYGENDLFGSQTVYMKANDRVSFHRNGQEIVGHTITLIKQIDGNMHTQVINKSKF